MSLTKAERETVILYNEAGPNAIVYTHNKIGRAHV